MLTRNSGLMPPPDALQDPPDPNSDDDEDSVAGMPELVNRCVDYDSSDDEDMTNYDDEDKDEDDGDDDDVSQDNDNKGEEVNSSSTVNPEDHVLISVDVQNSSLFKRCY